MDIFIQGAYYFYPLCHICIHLLIHTLTNASFVFSFYSGNVPNKLFTFCISVKSMSLPIKDSIVTIMQLKDMEAWSFIYN